MSQTQEWALARLREENVRNDPPFYSVDKKEFPGHTRIWLNLRGNVGWYLVAMSGIELKDIHALAYWYSDSLIHLLNPKQRRKIAALVNT